jgi:DnaJ-class molecular chaperone
MTKSYYDILEVKNNATLDEIKKSYKQLARKWHPDKNPSNNEAEIKFKDISHAYDILSNEQSRKMYDLYGEDMKPNINMNDIFTQMRQQQRQTQSIHFNMNITLEDVYLSTIKRIRMKRKIICIECDGNGTKDITNKITCDNCKGAGFFNKIIQNGFITLLNKEKCKKCDGKGHKFNNPCDKCNGETVIMNDEILEINIPKGITNGTKIIFKEKSDEMKGYKTGDLTVIINVQEHKEYKRKNNDLYLERSISLKDALIGTTIKIKLLDNTEKEFHFDAPIKPQENRCIPNYGINDGNLYIIFKIEFPSAEFLINKKNDIINIFT